MATIKCKAAVKLVRSSFKTIKPRPAVRISATVTDMDTHERVTVFNMGEIARITRALRLAEFALGDVSRFDIDANMLRHLITKMEELRAPQAELTLAAPPAAPTTTTMPAAPVGWEPQA